MNYATKITLDRLIDHDYEPASDLGAVTEATVSRAIESLDEKNHTLLCLEGEGDQWPKLMVGGGRGNYILMYVKEGAHPTCLTVVDSDKDEGIETLVVGGQEGEYPKNLIVDIDTAKKVALYFMREGGMHPDVEWGSS